MPKNADVDRYISKAAPFAQPILEKIRDAFHAAGREIDETIKWGVPHFEYQGVLGSMAAFKQHVGWGFWKSKLMKDAPATMTAKVKDARELPSKKEMVALVKEAIRLNEEGVKLEREVRKRPALDMPDDLDAALKKNRKAKAVFDKFPPSHRRDYIEWITDAKQEATRQKRLETALEWMSEGKPRNWKYMK